MLRQAFTIQHNFSAIFDSLPPLLRGAACSRVTAKISAVKTDCKWGFELLPLQEGVGIAEQLQQHSQTGILPWSLFIQLFILFSHPSCFTPHPAVPFSTPFVDFWTFLSVPNSSLPLSHLFVKLFNIHPHHGPLLFHLCQVSHLLFPGMGDVFAHTLLCIL